MEKMADYVIGPDTVESDEWLDVSVDLTEFAGRRVSLALENVRTIGTMNGHIGIIWNSLRSRVMRRSFKRSLFSVC